MLRILVLLVFHLFFAAFLGQGVRSFAAPLEYEIYADGDRIGRTHLESLSDAESGDQEVRLRTRIRVKALFLTLFSLDSTEKAVIDSTGLAEYESHTKIKKTRIDVVARRGDEALKVELRVDGEPTGWSFSTDDFDVSSIADLRADTLAIDAPETLRVLDLDELEVDTRIYRRFADEPFRIGDRELPAIAVEIQSSKHPDRPTTRWYSLDRPELLLEERGTDEDGPYRLTLHDLPTEEARR